MRRNCPSRILTGRAAKFRTRLSYPGLIHCIMTQFIYLHGFASGPGSTKARYLGTRWQAHGVSLLAPDLSPGPFEDVTISGQLEVVEQTVAGRPSVLIGSSMGGYLAALYAARHPREVEKVVLLAPAFRFASRWAERLGPEAMEKWRQSGFLEVFHYAQDKPARAGYDLFRDALQYPDFPRIQQPCFIIHGTRDEVVPVEYSIEYARQYPAVKLLMLDDGHELRNDLDGLAKAIEEFLGLC